MFSRREADQAIADQRVAINKRVAKMGDLVKEGDVVYLDGEVINPYKKPKEKKHGLPPAVNPKSKATRLNQKKENKKRKR